MSDKDLHPVLLSEGRTTLSNAESSSAAAVSHKNLSKHRRDYENELMELIDGIDFSQGDRVQLNRLQRACMRVPHFSSLLSGDRRFKLWAQLLLHDAPLQDIPESFASFAGEPTEAQRTAAAEITALLPDGFIDEAEATGFACYVASHGDITFDEENRAVLGVLVTALLDAALPSSHALLHLLFNLMLPLHKDFVPPSSSRLYEKSTEQLLRLLLQYHDPTLSVHLDHHQISIGGLLLYWARHLFVLRGEYHAALEVLDWVLVLGDPALLPYIALAYLIANRQPLLKLTTADALRDTLENMVVALPGRKEAALNPHLADGRTLALMPVWSGKTLLQNSDLLYRNTPLSAQRILEFCFYSDASFVNKTPGELEQYYAAAPCLPLEHSDLVLSFAAHPTRSVSEVAPLQYIVVDCRSHTSFNYARLPTAVFVGDVVSYDTNQLHQLTERLLSLKGAHYVVFGTGRGIVEELNLLKVVALRLVQQQFPFVSLATGGFRALIPSIRSRTLRMIIENVDVSAEKPSNDGGTADTGAASVFPIAIGTAALQSALTGLNGLKETLLPRVTAEADFVRDKADLYKERAKQGITAAGSWGWGLVQKLRGGLNAEQHADPLHSGQAADETPAVGAGPLQGRVKHRAQAQIFTLGYDDDDDDFGLITAVPVRPLKGTVIAHFSAEGAACHAEDSPQQAKAKSELFPASAPLPGAAPAHDEPHAEGALPTPKSPKSPKKPPAPAASPSSAYIVDRIDSEFNELFGDLSEITKPDP